MLGVRNDEVSLHTLIGYLYNIPMNFPGTFRATPYPPAPDATRPLEVEFGLSLAAPFFGRYTSFREAKELAVFFNQFENLQELWQLDPDNYRLSSHLTCGGCGRFEPRSTESILRHISYCVVYENVQSTRSGR